MIDIHIDNAIAPQLPRPGAQPVHLRPDASRRTTSPDADAADRAAGLRSATPTCSRPLDSRLRRQDALDPLIAGLDQLPADRLQHAALAEAAPGPRPVEGRPARRIERYTQRRPGEDPLSRRATRCTSCWPGGWSKRACRSSTSTSATGTGTARTSSPAGSRSRCSTPACRPCSTTWTSAACSTRPSCWRWARWAASRKCGTDARTPAATTGTTPSSCWPPAAASRAAHRRRDRQARRAGHRQVLQGRELRPHAVSPARHRPRHRSTRSRPARQADRRGRPAHQGSAAGV